MESESGRNVRCMVRVARCILSGLYQSDTRVEVSRQMKESMQMDEYGVE